MINQLGQSDYFSWSIMKSQWISNTLNVRCKEVANKAEVKCTPHDDHLSKTIYNQL